MHRPNRTLRHRALSVFVRTGLASLSAIPLAHANTCIVNSNLDDPGDGATTGASTIVSTSPTGTLTLRDCIVAANLMTGSTGAPNGNMLIVFDSTVFTGGAANVITLTSDLPLIFNNLTIDAGAAAPTPITIDGQNAHRIFFVSGLPDSTQNFNGTGLPDPDGSQPVSVILRSLILRNGKAIGGNSGQAGGGMGAGGALFVNKQATVTLDDVSFVGNATQGGSSALAASSGLPSGGGSVLSGGGGLGGSGGSPGGGGIGTAGIQSGGGFGGMGIGQISVAQGFGVGFGGGGYSAFTAAENGGIGQGGGGSFISSAGNGGFGAGGGASAFGSPGGGGFAGGGGGATSGNGGFGGGGGGRGGQGGFGGGGGSGALGPAPGGIGGGAGGNVGGADFGGGGAGLGGGVFVRAGGALYMSWTYPGTYPGFSIISGNSVAAGSGYRSGAAAGSGLFLMSGTTTTIIFGGVFYPSGALTISDSIADDSAASLPPGQSYTAGTGAGASLSVNAAYGVGAGPMILSNTSTYAGSTDINGGTVQLDGTLTASPINIFGGGRLTGIGTAGNGITLGAPRADGKSAILGPGDGTFGDGVGTLHATSLDWQSGGELDFQLGSTSVDADQLQLSGSLFSSSAPGGLHFFHFTNGAGGPPAVGVTYTLITFASTTFSASDFTLLQYNGLAGTFALVPAVNPTALTFTPTALPVRLQSFDVD